ncbi:MAG: hypothetical protein IJX47_07865 [Clostridia bacterium]|nr:hypothetical protein [Clostridia bacterium]
MSNQSKSMLISSGVFLVFILEHFILQPIESNFELWLVEYLIPLGLFLSFWILRSILKSRGHWHFSGTAWLVSLMTLLGIGGIYYFFFLHSNAPLSSLNNPLHQLALFGAQMAVSYLIAEIVIAVISWLCRLLERRL